MSQPQPVACLQCGRTDSWVDVTIMGSAVTTMLCSNCGQQAFTAIPSGAVYYTTFISSNTTNPTPLYSTSSSSSYGSSYGPMPGSRYLPPPSGPLEPEPLPDLPLAFDDKPLIGWRLWRVQPDWQTLAGEQRPRLCGIAQDELWPAGRAQNARCVRGTKHEAPHRECACGNWAVRESSAQNLRFLIVGLPCCVVGRVAMWGHVLEFERGYRAQYAYPLDLQYVGSAPAPEGMLQQLCADYNVPAADGFQTLPSGFWDQHPGVALPGGGGTAAPAHPRPATPPWRATPSRQDDAHAYTAHMMWLMANKARGWFAT